MRPVLHLSPEQLPEHFSLEARHKEDPPTLKVRDGGQPIIYR